MGRGFPAPPALGYDQTMKKRSHPTPTRARADGTSVLFLARSMPRERYVLWTCSKSTRTARFARMPWRRNPDSTRGSRVCPSRWAYPRHASDRCFVLSRIHNTEQSFKPPLSGNAGSARVALQGKEHLSCQDGSCKGYLHNLFINSHLPMPSRLKPNPLPCGFYRASAYTTRFTSLYDRFRPICQLTEGVFSYNTHAFEEVPGTFSAALSPILCGRR